MIDPSLVSLGFLGVTVSCVVALVVIVYRVTEERRHERELQNQFVLSVVERALADSVTEAVQADLLRETEKLSRDQDVVRELAYSSEVEEQRQSGFYGDLGMGRAVMKAHGLNPDDAEAVKRHNARYGEVVQ